MRAHVFTYGSLMFASVWSRVVLGRYAHAPARLQNYQRFAILDALYPAIVSAPGAEVHGRVFFDVDCNDLLRLDAFEGTDYARSAVLLRTAHSAVPAQVYTYRQAARLSPKPWSSHDFKAQKLPEFLATYAPTGV